MKDLITVIVDTPLVKTPLGPNWNAFSGNEGGAPDSLSP